MKKNKVLVIIIIIILIGTTGISFITWLLANKKSITMQLDNGVNTVGTIMNGIMANEKGEPLYMVDGIIEQIVSANPLHLVVKIRLTNIFKEPKQEEMAKTIIAQKDTTFFLNNIIAKQLSPMDPKTIGVGDDVVVATVEPSSDILKIQQFTATRIVKNQ